MGRKCEERRERARELRECGTSDSSGAGCSRLNHSLVQFHRSERQWQLSGVWMNDGSDLDQHGTIDTKRCCVKSDGVICTHSAAERG